MKSKPRFVQRTRDFHAGLQSLLGLLGYNPNNDITTIDSHKILKILSTSELSLISFAKKTIGAFDSSSSFTPLTVSSQTVVSQCFSPVSFTFHSKINLFLARNERIIE
jgi:hypothetical protein